MPRTTARFRAFKKVCDALGGQQGLAEALAIQPPSVSGWLERKPNLEDVRVPAGRCAAIEALAKGAVTAEQLRPDLIWVRDDKGAVTGFVEPVQPAAGKPARSRTAA